MFLESNLIRKEILICETAQIKRGTDRDADLALMCLTFHLIRSCKLTWYHNRFWPVPLKNQSLSLSSYESISKMPGLFTLLRFTYNASPRLGNDVKPCNIEWNINIRHINLYWFRKYTTILILYFFIFPNTEMMKVSENLPHGNKVAYIEHNLIPTDYLAMQGDWSSTVMVLI